MAKMSAVALNNSLRDSMVAFLMNTLNDMEPLQVASGKIACPAVDEEGNEKWVVFTISIPKGSRDGDEFDGYAEAENYKFEVEEKAEKARAREAEKARKEAERAAKKAEREAAKKAKVETEE